MFKDSESYISDLEKFKGDNEIINRLFHLVKNKVNELVAEYSNLSNLLYDGLEQDESILFVKVDPYFKIIEVVMQNLMDVDKPLVLVSIDLLNNTIDKYDYSLLSKEIDEIVRVMNKLIISLMQKEYENLKKLSAIFVSKKRSSYCNKEIMIIRNTVAFINGFIYGYMNINSILTEISDKIRDYFSEEMLLVNGEETFNLPKLKFYINIVEEL